VQCLIELAPDSPAVVLLACDQPLVTGKTVEGLVQQWRKTGKAIVASSYSNTLGVPALFGSSCFQELMQLKQNSGAKPIILANRDRVADVHFPEGAGDIDTIEDYERLTSNR
jgi:molybdenum cofactor cytidylyltransferase